MADFNKELPFNRAALFADISIFLSAAFSQ
jgi:hypothetical protein